MGDSDNYANLRAIAASIDESLRSIESTIDEMNDDFGVLRRRGLLAYEIRQEVVNHLGTIVNHAHAPLTLTELDQLVGRYKKEYVSGSDLKTPEEYQKLAEDERQRLHSEMLTQLHDYLQRTIDDLPKLATYLVTDRIKSISERSTHSKKKNRITAIGAYLTLFENFCAIPVGFGEVLNLYVRMHQRVNPEAKEPNAETGAKKPDEEKEYWALFREPYLKALDRVYNAIKTRLDNIRKGNAYRVALWGFSFDRRRSGDEEETARDVKSSINELAKNTRKRLRPKKTE